MFLFVFLGNIYILIFGINLLSSTLDSIFFQKINLFLEKINSPFLFLLLGITFSFLTQSSTAISLITIALLNSNKLNLKKGIAVMLGANVGTTFTALLTGFKIDSFYYVFFILAFVFAFLKKHKYISNLFASLGLIFLGIYMLKTSISYLYKEQLFINILNRSNNRVLISTFNGIIITAIFQSSSALVALTQQLVESNMITMITALSLVIGSNIGTTFTSIIVSTNLNIKAKALALSHFLINLFGVILILPFIKTLSLLYISNKSIFLFKINLLFNFISSIVAFLFLTPLSKLSLFIVSARLKRD